MANDEQVQVATDEEREFTRADALGVYLSDDAWRKAKDGHGDHLYPKDPFSPEDFAAFGQSFDLEFWDEEDDVRFGESFERIYTTVTDREMIIAKLLERIDADARQIAILTNALTDIDVTLRSVTPDGDPDAEFPAYVMRRARDTEARVKELERVTGPVMPCGDFAVQHEETFPRNFTLLQSDFEGGCTCSKRAPEYLAWKESRL